MSELTAWLSGLDIFAKCLIAMILLAAGFVAIWVLMLIRHSGDVHTATKDLFDGDIIRDEEAEARRFDEFARRAEEIGRKAKAKKDKK